MGNGNRLWPCIRFQRRRERRKQVEKEWSKREEKKEEEDDEDDDEEEQEQEQEGEEEEEGEGGEEEEEGKRKRRTNTAWDYWHVPPLNALQEQMAEVTPSPLFVVEACIAVFLCFFQLPLHISATNAVRSSHAVYG
jgi:hypothetical protein